MTEFKSIDCYFWSLTSNSTLSWPLSFAHINWPGQFKCFLFFSSSMSVFTWGPYSIKWSDGDNSATVCGDWCSLFDRQKTKRMALKLWNCLLIYFFLYPCVYFATINGHHQWPLCVHIGHWAVCKFSTVIEKRYNFYATRMDKNGRRRRLIEKMRRIMNKQVPKV